MLKIAALSCLVASTMANLQIYPTDSKPSKDTPWP
jgi:hypothetical protein